jgi:hypothetical protein
VFSILRRCPNARSPRRRQGDDTPNLGTKALRRAIEDLAKARELVGARVGYKVNARGEHVVALIFESLKRT